MVYDRHPYEAELTTIPEEMEQMNNICKHCLSRCRPTHQRIKPYLIHFQKIPRIDNEVMFD
jgi:hypothetical protein